MQIIQQESVGGQLGLTALKEQSLLDTYYATAKQSVILFTKPTHVVLIGTRDEIMSLLTLSDAFTFVPTLYLNGVLVNCYCELVSEVVCFLMTMHFAAS